jgi:hypothetical protein
MPYQSRVVAGRKGALASVDAARPLWDYSKRELLEIALHLGQQATEDFTEQGASGQS